MWISNAKSDESIGITGLVVPRHSLENDLVLSLNLLKTESGLLKPQQLLGRTRRRTSRLRTPAMSSPLRPRRARTRERGAGLGPAVGQRRRQRPLLHGPGAAGVLRRPHTICLCESGEPDDEARGLDHPPQAEPRAEAVLLSSPPADAFRPPEPLSALALLGLDARGPYPSGMTGTGRAITQTRVSHHSEPVPRVPQVGGRKSE